MIPLRLVIDTSVMVSAALTAEGTQRMVVLLAMTKPARWYVSDVIVAEYAAALARPEYSIPQERASATSVWEKSSPLNNNDSFLALARA